MVYIILESGKEKKSEDFTVEFSKPFHLKKLALQSFSLYVSWYNIEEKNNKFSYYDGSKWTDLIIPNGRYGVTGLNRFMIAYFGSDPPILFGIVEERQRISIKLKQNYKIDLTKSDLHKILGFEPMIYDKEEQIGKYIADIENGNDNIYIHCDVIEGAYINQFPSEVIHTFTTSNRTGSQYSKHFDRPIYFPVKTDSIYRIRMTITNHRGELLNLHNQEVQYVLIGE